MGINVVKTIRRGKIITSLFYAILLILPAATMAAVINIPDDYATVQEGIDNALDNDTVLVAPGLYVENLRIIDKQIVLSSRFLYDKDPAFIFNTILDGSNQDHPDTGSTILIKGTGIMKSPTVQGFTITGGTGTLYEWQTGFFDRQGGGILMVGSAAAVKYNLITDNHASNDAGIYSAGGGGILTNNSAPAILNNIIVNNEGKFGAGMSMNYSTGTVKNNVIAYNYGGEKYGGSGFSKNRGNITILENNTIVYNRSAQPGGGMAIFSATIVLRNTILWHNTAPTDPQFVGITDANYCNVEGGGLTGTGNIDIEPRLTYDYWCFPYDDSPCIDAGMLSSLYYDVEDPANAGSAMWPSSGTLTNDIGAYGGPGVFTFHRLAVFSDETAGEAPFLVNFSAKSIIASVDSWIWFFGNGDSIITTDPSCSYSYSDPGIYDVGLKAVVGTDTTLFTREGMIIATADTMSLGNNSGGAGQTLDIILSGNNTAPLDSLIIPLQYPGDLVLHYAGASTAGLRSEGFTLTVIDDDESANQRVVLRMDPGSGSPIDVIPSGEGPLAVLQFEIVSGTNPRENTISLEGYSSYALTYFSGPITYQPAANSGTISVSVICGDVDGNETVNVLDIIYLIDYKFKGGPAPAVMSAADVNSDGSVNVLDIIYMIDYKFKGGPAPIC